MANKKKKLSDEVLKELMKRIEDGTYPAGSQLPNEIELAEEMGVSRTTIREAEKYLVTMNILSKTRGRGTYVLDKEEQAAESESYDQINYMKNRLADLYDLRMQMEPGIACLATIKATVQELDEIEAIGKKIEAADISQKDVIHYNHEYHKAISLATHNPLIISTFEKLNNAIAECLDGTNAESMNNEDVIRSHRMITQFMRLRDQAGAKKAMELHLRYSVRDFSV